MTANTIFETILNGWWQGIVLTVLVWLVLRDLPRISASTRLAIWHVTLAMVLLLPALQRIPWSSLRRLTGPSISERTRSTAPPIESTQGNRSALAEPSQPLDSASTKQPVIELSDHQWPENLVVLAAALALFQLLRLAVGYWVIRRLKRKAIPAGLPAPVSGLGRKIQVMLSDRIGMPMAVGYRRPAILLPRTLAGQLTEEELRHVLLHESAHLLRKDDWIALAERVIRAVFFFQPAVYWIGRQIEREREIACDDWVIEQSGDSTPYAKSLARVAELGSAGWTPMLASGAGQPKAIFSRVETLLDRTRNRLPSVSEPIVMLGGLLILLAVSQGAHFNHLLGISNFSHRSVESNGAFRREFKMRGEIHFIANDTDVESMSPGARLVVDQSDGWRRRLVDFEADGQGVIRRRYWSDGAEQPYNDEAKRFLAKLLPQWVREQGIDIPERLARIVGEKGADGALEEIRLIRGAHVKRRYFEELFVQTPLEERQMIRALKLAGEMGSDYDKRLFLENVRDRYTSRPLDSAVLGFIDSISSDYDRRLLLSHAIERGDMELSLPRVLRSVTRISSDGDKTTLLQKAAQTAKGQLPEAFFEAAGTIHSDADRGRLLTTVMSLHGDDPASLTRALRIAAMLSSDGEKARALTAAARGFHGQPEALAEAGRVLGSMHSDGDRRRSLEALFDADGRNAATQRELLLQTAGMNSDGDKAHVLIKAAAHFDEQEPVRRAFFSAVNTIHSSGDHRRVLLAVLNRAGLQTDTLRDISHSASRISSDSDQSAVLKALSNRP